MKLSLESVVLYSICAFATAAAAVVLMLRVHQEFPHV